MLRSLREMLSCAAGRRIRMTAREIEVDRTMFVAADVEEQGKFLHVAEMRREGRKAPGHLGVAFEHFVDVWC